MQASKMAMEISEYGIGFNFRCSVMGGQLLSVACISIGHFLDGAVLAYTSTAIPSMTNTTDFDFQHLPLVRKLSFNNVLVLCNNLYH